MRHEVEFIPSGRGKAQCAPDPRYPRGIAVDCSFGRTACTVTLPYPAPECGHFRVVCRLCETSAGITAAGRPDDPISVKIPCKLGPFN